MSTTIEITLSDDGKITVGMSDQPTSTEQQPVADIKQALAMANHLLTQASAAPGNDNEQGEAQAGMSESGQSEAPGAPPGGVSGMSDNSGAVSTSDPSAIWKELAAKGQPTH